MISDPSTLEQVMKNMNDIGNILSDEDLDEKTAEGFLDFIDDIVFNDSQLIGDPSISRALGVVARRFIGNKYISRSVLRMLGHYSFFEGCNPIKSYLGALDTCFTSKCHF